MATLPPLAPPDAATPLTNHEIAANLQTIFQAPSTISTYGSLYALPYFEMQDFLSLVGFAIYNKGGDVVAPTFRFPASGMLPDTRDVQIFARAVSELESSATPIFSGSAQNFEVFMGIDKISSSAPLAQTILPYQSAKLLSSAFTYGLATRLLLEKYKTNWEAFSKILPFPLPLIAAPPLGPPIPNPVRNPLNAADWYKAYLTELSNRTRLPATWNALSRTHGTTGYFQLLSLMTDASLQTVGIVMGWAAGDALTDGSYAGAADCQTAFWKNLHSKYTTIEVGMMVGYTFEFLAGFLASERMKAMVAGNRTPPPQSVDPIKAPKEIYNYLNDTSVANKLSGLKIADDFFAFVLGEFHAIAGDPAKAAEYQGFLQGYQRGIGLAADVMFQELFENGYELGFTNGFEKGYTQGYSAGWTAGVAYGAGQDTWMSGATKILGGISQVLRDANTLASNPAVGTVITTIFL